MGLSMGPRALVLLLLVNCAQEPKVASMPPQKPVPLLRSKPASLPEVSYWLDASVSIAPKTVAVARPPFRAPTLGASAQRLSATNRAQLLEHGFAIDEGAPIASPPFEYLWTHAALGHPTFISSDALMLLLRAAMHRALAEAEAVAVLPLLRGLVTQQRGTLRAEAVNAPADLRTSLMIAQRFLLVCELLLGGVMPQVEPLDAAAAEEEVKRIENASAQGPSAVFGGALDYRVFAHVSPGLPRALAWLSVVPFPLLAKTEDSRARSEVGLTRDRFRAALLLAHSTDAEVDSRSAAAFQRLDRYQRWLFGQPDDASLSDLQRSADKARIDLAEPGAILDIVRVDRLRKSLARATRPETFDMNAEEARTAQPPVPLLRYFPPARTFDTVALSLPAAVDDEGHAVGDTITRVLGEREPHRTFVGDYDERIARLRSAYSNPGDSAHHASVMASLLDIVSSLTGPSAADSASLLAVSSEWEARRTQGAAAMWALVRKQSHLAGRSPIGLQPINVPLLPNRDAAPRVYVEAMPEAILKMLLSLGQFTRGLGALGMLSREGTAERVLREVESLLRTSLAIAIAEGEDTESSPELGVGILERAAWLERALAPSGAFDLRGLTPVVTNEHSGTTVAVGVAAPHDLIVVARVPGSDALEVAQGFVLPYEEVTIAAGGVRTPVQPWRKSSEEAKESAR